jgi:hypothetical protein
MFGVDLVDMVSDCKPAMIYLVFAILMVCLNVAIQLYKKKELSLMEIMCQASAIIIVFIFTSGLCAYDSSYAWSLIALIIFCNCFSLAFTQK